MSVGFYVYPLSCSQPLQVVQAQVHAPPRLGLIQYPAGIEPERRRRRTSRYSLVAGGSASSAQALKASLSSLRKDEISQQGGGCDAHGHKCLTAVPAPTTAGQRMPSQSAQQWDRGVVAHPCPSIACVCACTAPDCSPTQPGGIAAASNSLAAYLTYAYALSSTRQQTRRPRP